MATIHLHQFVGRTLQHRKYQRRTSTLCSVWATTGRMRTTYQLLKSWHSQCEAIDHEDDRAPDLYNVHIGPGATHTEALV